MKLLRYSFLLSLVAMFGDASQITLMKNITIQIICILRLMLYVVTC